MALRKRTVEIDGNVFLSKRFLWSALLFVFFAGIAIGFVLISNTPVKLSCPNCNSSLSCPVGEALAAQTQGTTASVTASLSPLSEQTLSASMRVLAVRSDTGQGAVGRVNVEIRPGKGRVLVNTNPFVEPDTQYSADTAARVAAQFAKKSIADRDVIFSFESSGELVGGPSAGAAMTIATIAALTGKTPNASVAMTGTIDSDGRVGFIGGLIEKSDAAAADGVKLFLVPKGQEVLQYYSERQGEETQNGVTFVRTYYIPVQLDLNAYTSGEYNMTTRGVSTIAEAAKAFFG